MGLEVKIGSTMFLKGGTFMPDWEEYTKGKTFITDIAVKKGSPDVPIASFAVWKPHQELNKHQIVEVSKDLNYLKDKFNVKNEYIFRLNK